MKISKFLLAVLALGLLAAPASALLQYSNINWPGEGPLDTGDPITVDHNGVVGIAWGSSARTWDGGSNYDDWGGPAGRQVERVFGKTTSGYIATQTDGDQWAWYSNGSTWDYAESVGNKSDFSDQNDTHAVTANWANDDIFLVDLATEAATYIMKGSNARISANGMISGANYHTLWDGSSEIDTGIINYGVNDSANTAGVDAVDGLAPYFYDYATSSLTAIPTFGDLDPAGGNEYRVAGISNDDTVVGYVFRGGETYRGWLWQKGDSSLTDLATVVDLTGTSVDAGTMFYSGAKVYDINDDGWITARARKSDGTYELCLLRTETVPPVPKNRGDVTEDDFVGADDLVRILTHWGESGSVPWENGDCAPYGDGSAPGDDFVGADDYVEVLTYWGTDYSSPEPAPEPATLVLLLVSSLAVLKNRR